MDIIMTVNRNELLRALDNIYGKKGMSSRDVEDLCDFILSFFGYDDYVLDNVLSPSERDVFYNLEESGILSTHREEISIIKGKTWRINQWYIDSEKIKKIANERDDNKKEENIYDSIFKNMQQ